jgi:uncharacterized protein (DUF1501 family)
MKRKDFLKKASIAGLAPFIIDGLTFKVHGASSRLENIARAAAKNGRVFVLIQLNGGNDGLNTVIPTDQYTNLSSARSNVLIPENKVLKLNGINGTGLHPSMSEIKTLFDDKKINIVQSVGYPNPNFSHFRSTDIWHTASDSNQFLTSGWGGRYLQNIHPDFPEGYPSAAEPDPLAISIGFSISTVLMGDTVNAGMAISDPKTFYELVSGTVDPAPDTPAGHELTYVRLILQQTQSYNTTVKAAALNATNKATYPSNNRLAAQLKIVANLIAGGLQTPLYTVSLGGFDTHANQVATTGGNETGAHANLWKTVSEAISVFQSDCEQLGIADRVAGMTYTEFGRRIKSNDSNGTDHGAAAPLIVFGTQVNPIIIGNNPTIPSSVSVNDNVPMQYDFRQVYSTVLKDWFQVSDTDIQNDILFKQFTTLPIFNQNLDIDKKIAQQHILLKQNYPNPFKDKTVFEYHSPGGRVELKLFDAQGRLVSVLTDENLPSGKHEFVLNGDELPSGNYYYQLITSAGQISRQMIKY